MKTKKYIENPLTVEAIQYTGTNWEEIDEFVGEKGKLDYSSLIYHRLFLKRRVNETDYIFKSNNGVPKCMSKKEFEESFTEVTEAITDANAY